jgi:hypothetical protein
MIYLYKWKKETLIELNMGPSVQKRLYIKLKSYEYSNLHDIFQQISFLRCLNEFLSNKFNSTRHHEKIVMKKNNVFESSFETDIKYYKNKKQKSLFLDSCVKLGPIFNKNGSQLIPSFKFNETNTSFIYTFLNYDRIEEYSSESNACIANEKLIERDYSGNYLSFLLIFNPKNNSDVINLFKEKISNIKISGLKENKNQYNFTNNIKKYDMYDIGLLTYSSRITKNGYYQDYLFNQQLIPVNNFSYCYESINKITNNQEENSQQELKLELSNN